MHRIEAIGLALVGHLATRTDGLKNLQILVRDLAAPGEIERVQGGEFLRHPADAGAQDDAAIGKYVQRGQHASQQNGIAVGHYQNRRADFHSISGAYQNTHGGDGFKQRFIEGHWKTTVHAIRIVRGNLGRKDHVIGQPDRMKTLALGQQGKFQNLMGHSQPAIDANIQPKFHFAYHPLLHMFSRPR